MTVSTGAVSTRAHPYRGPVAWSLVFHVGVVAALVSNLSFCRHELVLPPVPEHVRAVVIERETMRPVVRTPVAEVRPAPEPLPPARVDPLPAPKPVPKPVPRPVPKPESKPAAKPATKPAPKPAPKPAVSKPVEKPVPRPVVPVADFDALLAQEETVKRAREDALSAAARKEEAESSERAARDAQRVNEYSALIRAEVEKRWNRPPSAREGMQAELRITLIPGGDVIDVRLLRSSGDTAFDRSAENAVRMAGRLPVPADPALFNNYFRQFRFLFRPEGLNP